MHREPTPIVRDRRPREKRAALTLGLALAVAGLAACGGSGATGSSAGSGGAAASSGSAKSINVGVLIPGSIDDAGFMQSAYEGVKQAQATLAGKAKVTYVEQVASADMQQALTQMASKSDLVVSIGGQTDEALRKVVTAFPKVKFVEVGGPPNTLANLAMYDPKQAEIAYVAGAAAALLSKTGKVQFVAGLQIPPIVNTANEFARGAKAAKPSVTVLPPAYTGDFDDVSKAKEAALSGISQGADIQYQILNLGLKGLVQAATEKGTHVIGGPLPQACGKDPAFIAYTKSDIGLAAQYAMKQVMAGTFAASYVPFGLASSTSASGLELCAKEPTVAARVKSVEGQIRSGAVKTI